MPFCTSPGAVQVPEMRQLGAELGVSAGAGADVAVGADRPQPGARAAGAHLHPPGGTRVRRQPTAAGPRRGTVL